MATLTVQLCVVDDDEGGLRLSEETAYGGTEEDNEGLVSLESWVGLVIQQVQHTHLWEVYILIYMYQ